MSGIVDKDKPWTWIGYRDGLCQGCTGACCTMPVEVHSEDLVTLGVCSDDDLLGSRKKLVKQLQKQGVIQSYRESTGLWMLGARPNGDCYFLHTQTRLCTVYEKRPGVCRQFPSIGPRPGFCPAQRQKRN